MGHFTRTGWSQATITTKTKTPIFYALLISRHARHNIPLPYFKILKWRLDPYPVSFYLGQIVKLFLASYISGL